MQLVLINNRVLTYGENFVSLAGIVYNTESEKYYKNATIAECESLPDDIDSVGYEYHAGAFVPCAPYGKGSRNGNIPVVCNEDCKAIKDSGIPFSQIGEIFEIDYQGNGSYSLTLPHDFEKTPRIIYLSGNGITGVVFVASGVGYFTMNDTTALSGVTTFINYPLTVRMNGKKAVINSSTGSISNHNASSTNYKAIVIC